MPSLYASRTASTPASSSIVCSTHDGQRQHFYDFIASERRPQHRTTTVVVDPLYAHQDAECASYQRRCFDAWAGLRPSTGAGGRTSNTPPRGEAPKPSTETDRPVRPRGRRGRASGGGMGGRPPAPARRGWERGLHPELPRRPERSGLGGWKRRRSSSVEPTATGTGAQALESGLRRLAFGNSIY